MRVLFGLPACEFSVSDVARGLRAALVRQGHELHDYDVGRRMAYHAAAMGPIYREQVAAVSKQASETLLIEAMYHQADLAIIVSALIYHPIAIALLRQARIPLAVIHTESPYEDGQQVEWSSAYPEALHCTHDRVSAARLGWLYLPHAYDPAIHRPCYDRTCGVNTLNGEPLTEWNNAEDEHSDRACDVLFLGTGWPERIALLEAIDWTGIDLKIRGLWPSLRADSPIRSCYVEGCVPNEDAVRYYRAARINLNIHRADAEAVSLNPRAYELAACGAFTITDRRDDGVALLGEAQPTFGTVAELGASIRRWLTDPAGRRRCAEQARTRISTETFDARAAALMAAVTHTFAARAA
jgi:glycosyltransferase involved in cell wall biosynthesis